MSCTLCDLPTPDPPLTDAAVDGSFCCRGCLEVARTLDDPAAASVESALAETTEESTAERSFSAGETVFFAVDGMHCATCETFLERQTGRLDGVYDVQASYPAGAVKVAYDADVTDPETVRESAAVPGYSFARPDDHEPSGEDTGRLLVGLGFGMMAMVWYLLFLYPAYLGLPPDLQLFDLDGAAGRYLIWNVWVFATVVLFYTGRPILRGAWISIRTRQPNMDLLVGTAATAAYVFSTLAALIGHSEVYFDVSIVVVLAVTVGGYYERRLTRRATDRLADVVGQRVDEARVVSSDATVDEPGPTTDEVTTVARSDTGTELVSLEELDGGEYVRVDPGERIPVDGTVIEGRAGVDASLVTGESRPVDVGPGDDVHGGTVVLDGVLTIEAAPGGASTVDRLIDLLWDVRAERSGAQRLADRLASVFVPFVLSVATIVTLWLLATGASPGQALLTGLTVLIVSCPCALGLATPLAMASGIRAALEQGIVLTDASVVERTAAIDIVALDKTGTLTTGQMSVVTVTASGARQCRPVLQFAAALEGHADHPVAAAIADAMDGPLPETADFRQHAGRGVSGTVRIGENESSDRGSAVAVDGGDRGEDDGDRYVVVGRRVLFEERDWDVPKELSERYAEARAAGQIPVLVGWDEVVQGLVVAADEPRDGWRDLVSTLGANRRVVIVSGDDPAAADRFGAHPAVDDVFAGVPPDAKPAVVARLQEDGSTAMVGDGSNDAPALARADLGIALGGGTDVAADAASVVIEDDVTSVPTVFALSRSIRRRVRENLAWAFLYNVLAIPAAVLGVLNPVVAAVAMATSSLLVVSNSARSFTDPCGDISDTAVPGT